MVKIEYNYRYVVKITKKNGINHIFLCNDKEIVRLCENYCFNKIDFNNFILISNLMFLFF